MSNTDKNINGLLQNQLHANLTDEEKKQLEDFFLDKENEFSIKHILYAQLNEFDNYPQTSGTNFDKLNRDFYIKVKELKKERDKSKNLSIESRRRQSLNRVIQIAAIFIIAFVFGFLYNQLAEQPVEILSGNNQQMFTTVAPLGAKSTVTLPDGSRIWLNAGSRITYTSGFNALDRKINLTGEAYFDVAENKSLPFEVSTSDIIVTALGTKFNVKAYPEEKIIETTLVEGKIKINKKSSTPENKEIVLLPNQQATYVKTSREISINREQEGVNANTSPVVKPKSGSVYIAKEIKPELYTSWKDERWYIQAEELSRLATKLERRFNVKIEFEDESLMSYKFTGSLQDETLEQLLNAIKLSAPIDYSIRENVVTLKENKQIKREFRDILKSN